MEASQYINRNTDLSNFLKSPIDSHYIPETIYGKKSQNIIRRSQDFCEDNNGVSDEWNKRLNHIMKPINQKQRFIQILPRLSNKPYKPPPDPEHKMSVESISNMRTTQVQGPILKPHSIPNIRYCTNQIFSTPFRNTIKLY